MICNGLAKERRFVAGVGFPAFIMCGSGHVVGKRLIEYTPFNDTASEQVALLVECGQHWAAATATTALDTALHFLRAAGAVPSAAIEPHLSGPARHPAAPEIWDVTHGITAQSDDFRFAADFVGLEVIAQAGTVIARDGDTMITTPYDDCLLMMPNHGAGAGVRKLRLCRRSA